MSQAGRQFGDGAIGGGSSAALLELQVQQALASSMRELLTDEHVRQRIRANVASKVQAKARDEGA
jgi:hypothetical protein